MIKPLGLDQIPEIARIHAQELKNDFLPSLGTDFLEVIYAGVIESGEAFGFVEKEKGKVVGFIVGTKNMDSFFKAALKSNILKIMYLLILKVLRKPVLIKNILETFLYTEKDKGPKSELVVIAVLKKLQGKGIGKKLVKSLESYFKKEHINKYKLTVYANKKAVNFYKKLRYLKLSEFNMYGRQWDIYEKKIN